MLFNLCPRNGKCPRYHEFTQRLLYSRFIWANGRAAGIGRTIPVRSIGRLPLLEALPSLPLDIWKRWQSFRNKMVEAGNET